MTVPKYRVDILDRIKELVFDGTDLGPEDEFTYSWRGGYEEVYQHTKGFGSSHYAGAYHPDGGYCRNGRDGEPGDDGTGICIYCGRTLH